MMRKIIITAAFGIALAGLVLLSHQNVSGQAAVPAQAAQSGPAGSIQDNPSAPDALTSFTISNPYCFQPDPAVDKCYVNFRFIQAVDNQSTSPFMTWMEIVISNKVRYTATAFFEGTISYNYDMVPQGIEVPCGAPNAGGAGNAFGNVYGVSVSPLDTSHTPMSTDIANVTCPAYNP